MKTASASSTSSRATARPRSTRQSDDYAPASRTRELLTKSLDARQKRLAAADMISTDEAAKLVHTSRVTINAWISKGRAIGLTQTKRGFRMPRWQFEPMLWETVPRLSDALGTVEGWALLAFLETPHGALTGRTPRQAVEQGEADQVVAIAEREGH